MEKERIIGRVLEANAEGMKKIEKIGKKRFAYGNLLKVVKEDEYFLGITGLRGIGKTVLLLQLASEAKGIYFSADDRELRGVDLYDIIKALSEAGHKKLFVDEIHAKIKWDGDLKTIFDEKLASITFSGSSAIQLKNLKADLSRRVVIEHLRPAGFREWLAIKKGIDVPKLTLKELIKKKAEIAREYGYLNNHRSETGGIWGLAALAVQELI